MGKILLVRTQRKHHHPSITKGTKYIVTGEGTEKKLYSPRITSLMYPSTNILYLQNCE